MGVVADWLPRLGAPEHMAPLIADEVAEQMEGLPTPLRVGVLNLQQVLSLLPPTRVPQLSDVPGAGEYVRLVRSLTTVVYLAHREAAP